MLLIKIFRIWIPLITNIFLKKKSLFISLKTYYKDILPHFSMLDHLIAQKNWLIENSNKNKAYFL